MSKRSTAPTDPVRFRLWYRYSGMALNADWPRSKNRAEMRAVRIRLAKKYREEFVVTCGKCGAVIPDGVDSGHRPCDAV